MSCAHESDVAAYLLHALPDDEAADFVAHLRGCRQCRKTVAVLRGAVDVLPMTVPPVAPPPELRDRIMRDVRREAALLGHAPLAAARAPRWRGLVTRPIAVAGMACALLAVGAGAALRDDDAPRTRTLAAQATPPDARASLRVTGDRVALHVERMPSAPRGRVYQVWLVKRGGKPEPTHTLFNVRDDGRAAVAIDEPVGGVEQILVSAEPSGGSTAPTSAPVITARPA